MEPDNYLPHSQGPVTSPIVRWGTTFHLTFWCLSSKLHDATGQKTAVFIADISTTPGKKTLVPTEKGAGWAPKTVWAIWEGIYLWKNPLKMTCWSISKQSRLRSFKRTMKSFSVLSTVNRKQQLVEEVWYSYCRRVGVGGKLVGLPLP